MSPSEENRELASAYGNLVSMRRAVCRAPCVAAVVIACHLPLVFMHFHQLWVHRPHYQFFPLLLTGIAWLLWKRWPRWTATAAAPWWSSALLVSGWMVLAAGTLVSSPWLASVAMVLSIGGLIGRYAIPGQWQNWGPVWLVMWLIVPPPLGLDFRLISWLQSSTSAKASSVLDLLGVLHLMEGHVLVLPGHRMLVDEACSGVNSVLVLLVLTSLFVVVARRPFLWSALLLASSVAWAWAGNVVRVTAIAVSQAWYQLDLSAGWQHELLGYVTISLALAWLASTDYFLAFVLWPIVLRGTNMPTIALATTPLTRVWNMCVGEESREHGEKRRRIRAGHPQPTGEASDCQRVESGTSRQPIRSDGDCVPTVTATGRQAVATRTSGDAMTLRWLVAFGMLAILQLVSYAVPVASAAPVGVRDSVHARFQRADMPATLDGWSLVEYEQVEREVGTAFGQFSNQWIYRRGATQCLASVDYPFGNWHDLTICYRGSGWTLLNRHDFGTDGASERDVAYVEAELSKPTGECGWLLFGLFDQRGERLVPPGARSPWSSISERLVRRPLISWLLRRDYTGEVTSTYQVQVFFSSTSGLTPELQAELRQLFFWFRSHVRNAYSGRTRKDEARGAVKMPP